MAEPLPWNEVQPLFDPKETDLIDLFATRVGIVEWEAVLEVIRQSYSFTLTCSTGNEEEPDVELRAIPPAAELIRMARSDEGPWPDLTFKLAGMQLRTFPSLGDEHIEFDFWVRELTESRYLAVTDFMEDWGTAAKCDVFIAMSDGLGPAQPIMLFDHNRCEFRKPLHGSGSDRSARIKMLRELADTLEHFRQDVGCEQRFSLEDISSALLAMERFLDRHSELELLDHFTGWERWEIYKIRSNLTMSVCPPAGVPHRKRTSSNDAELLDHLNRIELLIASE